MKKQIVITVTLASAVVLGGGFVLKSYADHGTSVVQPSVAEQQQIEVETSTQGVTSPPAEETDSLIKNVDIHGVPTGENFIPNLVGNSLLKSVSSSFQVVKQTDTLAQKFGDTLQLSTIYTLQDGTEVRLAQNPLDRPTAEQQADVFKRIYSQNHTVVDTEINGYKGLTVENDVKKIVYVLTDTHIFCIATISPNSSFEPLLDIAKQIKD
ncbi:hypothetical protein [Paenibacillus chibensis]|uniref:hypothetical protein n=1 Tax=Paenibacillus chibensis TaxID=59846 RepID=UPI000FDA8D4A|nr:hypothetical protein [Paenibacillus chibensis]MEC0373099.1 hypothetical protein [Paenibacillus chibensis]